MFSPLKKLMSFLGIKGVDGRDISVNQNWNPNPVGSAAETKVPLHIRRAKRRRQSKAARIARRHNRS